MTEQELGTGIVQYIAGVILFTVAYRGITGKWPWKKKGTL